MEYIHIKNLEKYHPGYKDRTLQWGKIYINMADGDPDTEMIVDEIDWCRFVKIILLELRAQKPLPNTDEYWQRKGFNLKKRPMLLTLQMLHNFIDIVTLDESNPLQNRNVDKSKNKIREREDKIYVDWEQSTLTTWNSFCDKKPILSKIQEISEKRRNKLKKRFERESFKNFESIIKAIEEQPFLLGQNDREWKISFDWLIENDTNYLKVLECKYKDKPKSALDKFMEKNNVK